MNLWPEVDRVKWVVLLETFDILMSLSNIWPRWYTCQTHKAKLVVHTACKDLFAAHSCCKTMQADLCNHTKVLQVACYITKSWHVNNNSSNMPSVTLTFFDILDHWHMHQDSSTNTGRVSKQVQRIQVES